MTTIIGIITFIVVALLGWAIAELKPKAFKYQENEEEEAVLEQARQQLEKNGYQEQDIHDVIQNISTKGFKAV
jgi:chorismate mutase